MRTTMSTLTKLPDIDILAIQKTVRDNFKDRITPELTEQQKNRPQ